MMDSRAAAIVCVTTMGEQEPCWRGVGVGSDEEALGNGGALLCGELCEIDEMTVRLLHARAHAHERMRMHMGMHAGMWHGAWGMGCTFEHAHARSTMHDACIHLHEVRPWVDVRAVDDCLPQLRHIPRSDRLWEGEDLHDMCMHVPCA